MGHWNHRIMAYQYKEEYYLRINEVFYDDTGKARHYAELKNIQSDSVKGLNWVLNKMKLAFKKPVLWAEAKFPEEFDVKLLENVNENIEK